MSRAAHSLTELVMAMALTATVLAALSVTSLGPTWSGLDPVSGDSPEVATVQEQLRKLTVEIQESTRLVYPLAGKGPQDGLALVNSRGETILYFVEPGEAGSKVTRANLNARRLGRPDAQGSFLDSVRHFRACVPPATPGKQPSLVELDIAIELASRGASAPRVVNRVTAVFPRNLEAATPEDIFPAGTPLSEPGSPR